jgi:hypothetical protein
MKWALQFICEYSDLVWVQGQPFLITPAAPALMDDLAAFDAEAAEMEDDDAEPSLGAPEGHADGPNEDQTAWAKGDDNEQEQDSDPYQPWARQ